MSLVTHTGVPQLTQPSLALEDLQKLITTTKKVAGYLEKSGDKEWWAQWLEQAKHVTEGEIPEDMHECEYIYFIHPVSALLATLWPLQNVSAKYKGEVVIHMEPQVVESPALSYMSVGHNQLSVLDVPGVGKAPTAWIGRAGQRRIRHLIEQVSFAPLSKTFRLS